MRRSISALRRSMPPRLRRKTSRTQPISATTSGASLCSQSLERKSAEVVALAKQGAGDATAADEQMQRLEDFVRGYIRNKDLNVGYTTALEVARKPEGDCTEHAVLLAA